MLTLSYNVDRKRGFDLTLRCGRRKLTSFTCYPLADHLRSHHRKLVTDLKTTTDDVDGECRDAMVDFGRIDGVHYFSIMHQGETAWMDIPEECNDAFLEFLDALVREDGPDVVTNVPAADPNDRVRNEVERSLESMERTSRHLKTHRYT